MEKKKDIMEQEGQGLGIEGFCVCNLCGYRIPHQREIPCYQQRCPKCGCSLVQQ